MSDVQADLGGVRDAGQLVRQVEASARAVSLENEDIVKVGYDLECPWFSYCSILQPPKRDGSKTIGLCLTPAEVEMSLCLCGVSRR